MLSKRRFIVPLAILAIAVFSVACGGQAAQEPSEEPAQGTPEEPGTSEPQPQPTEPQPEPEPEPQEPEQPQLVGTINLSGEDFQWGDITDADSPAPYTWTVTVTNDTTQTLDLTVRFDFLDDQDRVIKTERTTVRLPPADRRVIEEQGSMPYADANRVYSFAAQTERWEIVSS